MIFATFLGHTAKTTKHKNDIKEEERKKDVERYMQKPKLTGYIAKKRKD